MSDINEDLMSNVGRFVDPQPVIRDIGGEVVSRAADETPIPLTPLPIPAPVPEAPSFRQVLNAEFEQSNEVGSMLASDSSQFASDEYDPSFDLLGALKGSLYEGNPEWFVHARNMDHFLAIQRDIHREFENRETIERSSMGTWVPAMITAQLASPINLLSLGGAAGGRIAARGGYSLLSRGGLLGAGVGADTAIQETILQNTQTTRTTAESIGNIGGSVVLGSVLGYGLARMLDAGERLRFEAQVEAELRVPAPGTADPFEPGTFHAVFGGQGGLSADLAGRGADDYTMKSAGYVDKLLSIGPLGRTVRSPEKATRRIVNELAETPYWFKENAEGVEVASWGSRMGQPQAVETRIKLWDAPQAQASTAIRDAFVEYKLGRARKFGDLVRLQVRDRMGDIRGTRGASDMNEMEFRRAVTDALNNDDIHATAEVAKASKAAWESFLGQVDKDAITRGIYKEGKDGKRATIARSYIAEKIIAERSTFREIAKAHLYRRRSELQAELARIEREAELADLRESASRKAAEQEEASRRAGMSEDEAAQAELDMIRSAADARARGQFPAGAGPDGVPLSEQEIEHAVSLWQFVRDIRKERGPEGLATFLVKMGGLKDPSGDILQLIAKSNKRPGLINRGGSNLDDATLRAWEAGFIQSKERPDINDLVAALDSDLRGQKVVRPEDAQRLDDITSAQDAQLYLQQLGIHQQNLRTPNAVRDFLSGGASTAKRQGETFRAIEGGRTGASTAKRQGETFRAIEGGRTGDLEVTKTEFRAALKAMGERLKSTSKTSGKAAAENFKLAKEGLWLRMRASMDDAEINDMADDVVNRITMHKSGRLSYDLHLKRDEAGLVIEDEKLRPEDFAFPYEDVKPYVRRDAELLIGLIRHTLVPDIEIANRFGSVDMADQLKLIQDGYARKIQIASKDNPKMARELNGLMKRDVDDIAGMRDRLAHRYGLPEDPSHWLVRTGRVIRDFSVVTKLPLVVLSSVSDIGKLVWVRGMGGLLKDGLGPLLGSIEEMKAAMGDMRHMSVGLDTTLNTRAMAFAETMPEWGGNANGIDRVSADVARGFMKGTGLPVWTAKWKQIAGVLVSRNVLEAAATAPAYRTEKMTERLGHLGISPENAKIIAEQYKKHGTDKGNVWRAGAEKWDVDDTPEGKAVRAAREALFGAVRKEVDSIIVTPGQEIPLGMSKEHVKFFTLFKSFGVASIDRTLIAGLQQRDMAVLNGMIAMFTLGLVSNEVRLQAFPPGGIEPKSFAERWGNDKERNQMMIEAIDRAGIFGWLGDVDKVLTRAGGIGLSNLVGTGIYKHRAGQEVLDQIAGPNVGTINSAARVGVSLIDKVMGRRKPDGTPHEWTERETRELQRLVPFIGLAYIRVLIEKLGGVEAFNRMMDAKKAPARTAR